MKKSPFLIESAGLSLRRALLGPLSDITTEQVNFLEVAPENWINIGGRHGKRFKSYAERFSIGCHGLSLSLGGMAPLNWSLLENIKKFIADNNIAYYSEHLSGCDDNHQLYDLMPIPFTDEAVTYVANRIRQVQDFLERQIAIENISFYTPLATALTEPEFINAVIQEADCLMLLDVNNIFVNSINHRCDPYAFIDAMPADRVLYYHVAGHQRVAEDLCVDTHGQQIIDPVWQLLAYAYKNIGVKATLLERESNLPPVEELITELDQVRHLQRLAVAESEFASTSSIALSVA